MSFILEVTNFFRNSNPYVRIRELEKNLEIEAERSAEWQRLAVTDPLTGAYNRRGLKLILEQVPDPHMVLAVDIDHFKAVNDTWGHGVGDEVLVKVCKVLREQDVVARMGGEEFNIILYHATPKRAVLVAERIRERVANDTFSCGKITISIGVGKNEEKADEALYAAKNSGRNKVCISP